MDNQRAVARGAWWNLRTAGFTLIELMVAMVIGMVILLALTTLFLNTSRSNTELARTNTVIENGRFAIQLIENDLVHAGFWGDYVPQFDNLTATGVPSDLPTGIPAPCASYGSWPTGTGRATLNTQLLGIPVQAYDDAPTGCSGVIANRQADTDVIVVRRAETCVPGQANCDPDTAGRLYFQSSLCGLDAAPYVLDTAGFTLKRRDCGASSYTDKRRYISNIYYVRDFARTAGDGIPTLVRVRFDTTGFITEPLIEGIEAFRVELGIDDLSVSGASVNYSQAIAWPVANSMKSPSNRGDGSPDHYRRCTTASACTVAELVNAVAVKLFVLARASDASPGYQDTKTYLLGTIPETGAASDDISYGPFNDSFKRHLFSTTVRLHNVSGRRETPP